MKDNKATSDPYTFHPAADCFPLTKGGEFYALVSSIKAVGLLNPITTWNSEILDGRNRYLACIEAGVEPRFVEWEGTPEEAIEFVVGQNIARRHLNESQRAAVAGKLANMGQGDNQHTQIYVPSIKDAAAKLNVSPRSVNHAHKVQAEGTDALNAAVEQGDVSVSAAAELTKAPEVIQNRVAAHPEEAQQFLKKQGTRRRKLVGVDAAMKVIERILTLPPPKSIASRGHKNEKRLSYIDAAIGWLTEFRKLEERKTGGTK